MIKLPVTQLSICKHSWFVWRCLGFMEQFGSKANKSDSVFQALGAFRPRFWYCNFLATPPRPLKAEPESWLRGSGPKAVKVRAKWNGWFWWFTCVCLFLQGKYIIWFTYKLINTIYYDGICVQFAKWHQFKNPAQKLQLPADRVFESEASPAIVNPCNSRVTKIHSYMHYHSIPMIILQTYEKSIKIHGFQWFFMGTSLNN